MSELVRLIWRHNSPGYTTETTASDRVPSCFEGHDAVARRLLRPSLPIQSQEMAEVGGLQRGWPGDGFDPRPLVPDAHMYERQI